MTLAIGDPAPGISLPATNGDFRLSAHLGSPVVVYFYPKDDTPGCTREARDFSDLAEDFARAGAIVVGISKDSLDKHRKFAKKHDIRIALASDAEADVCERYGVFKEKAMYGRTYLGIERTSFLIDREGRIAAVWPKVKVAGHAAEVLKAVATL